MDLFSLCNIDRDLLEDSLKSIIDDDTFLDDKYKAMLLDLILASGKRIRPIFTIIGSQLGNHHVPNIYQLAALF